MTPERIAAARVADLLLTVKITKRLPCLVAGSVEITLGEAPAQALATAAVEAIADAGLVMLPAPRAAAMMDALRRIEAADFDVFPGQMAAAMRRCARAALPPAAVPA